MPAWNAVADGMIVAMRFTPRSARESFGIGTGGDFSARLAAPPVDGAANAALVALIAKVSQGLPKILGVARRSVSVVSGHAAWPKRVQMDGAPLALAEIARRLYEAAP